jgi:hypothetical protein
MSCQICLEIYNHSDLKTFICAHTVCEKCLNNNENKCPKCKTVYEDKQANLSLLELIPDIEAKQNAYLDELTKLKETMNINFEKKINENSLKIDNLRLKINERTSNLISLLLKEQKKLLFEVDQLGI